jgi:hypothetical protein
MLQYTYCCVVSPWTCRVPPLRVQSLLRCNVTQNRLSTCYSIRIVAWRHSGRVVFLCCVCIHSCAVRLPNSGSIHATVYVLLRGITVDASCSSVSCATTVALLRNTVSALYTLQYTYCCLWRHRGVSCSSVACANTVALLRNTLSALHMLQYMYCCLWRHRGRVVFLRCVCIHSCAVT